MKNYYVIAVVVVLLAIGCSDETTVFDLQSQGKALILEENNTTLLNSVSMESNGILEIYFEHEEYDNEIIEKNRFYGLNRSGVERASKNNTSTSNASSDFHLNLVGQVQSPSFDGNTNLGATHIDVDGNFAYVSYNTVGEVYAGAVDVIDLSDPLVPVLTSRMYLYDRDANVVLHDNGYLYVIGGVNTERVLEATGESFIAKIGVNNGSIDLNDINYVYQEGQTATGITRLGNSFYVSSGVEGVIAKYDADSFVKTNEVAYDDLRWVASSNNKIAVLDGGAGVRILDTDLNEVSQIGTRTDFVAGAKRTIAISDNKLIVAEGNNGAAIFDLDTATLEERLPILIDPDNVIAADKVTNAVDVEGNVTLLANGGAGLAIRVKNDIIDLMGVVELNGSINYVATDGDFIFAASGTRGLQIINKIRTQESLVIPEGNYIIRARNSGRAMGLSSLSTDDGINIDQRTRTGDTENEEWHLEVLDSGAYVLTSNFSNKAVASRNTNVEQWQFGSEADQQWVIEPGAQEGYFYLRNLGDNRYLDVFGRRNSFGTTIITWPFHGRTNQQWSFERLED
ncbi:hypothetical protein MTsPCn5_01420 [Croceitalea sp. MTPC5]|uniref:RICIN domain-containing protein n=1 Tax=Croceitalea sp. MTPC5 TaxID=3056565 RepID=UPI002B3FD707|nr:hypothetical protein MTsPCn5_01420 [Croceitalea sp. MTPC5]